MTTAGAPTTEFKVLGPWEVWHDGAPVPVPAVRVRVLPVSLLLRAGRTVSADALVERVTGPDRRASTAASPSSGRTRAATKEPWSRPAGHWGCSGRPGTGGNKPALGDLGWFSALAGRTDDAARSVWRRAEEVLVAIDHPESAAVRELLADLDRTVFAPARR